MPEPQEFAGLMNLSEATPVVAADKWGVSQTENKLTAVKRTPFRSRDGNSLIDASPVTSLAYNFKDLNPSTPKATYNQSMESRGKSLLGAGSQWMPAVQEENICANGGISGAESDKENDVAHTSKQLTPKKKGVPLGRSGSSFNVKIATNVLREVTPTKGAGSHTAGGLTKLKDRASCGKEGMLLRPGEVTEPDEDSVDSGFGKETIVGGPLLMPALIITTMPASKRALSVSPNGRELTLRMMTSRTSSTPTTAAPEASTSVLMVSPLELEGRDGLTPASLRGKRDTPTGSVARERNTPPPAEKSGSSEASSNNSWLHQPLGLPPPSHSPSPTTSAGEEDCGIIRDWKDELQSTDEDDVTPDFVSTILYADMDGVKAKSTSKLFASSTQCQLLGASPGESLPSGTEPDREKVDTFKLRRPKESRINRFLSEPAHLCDSGASKRKRAPARCLREALSASPRRGGRKQNHSPKSQQKAEDLTEAGTVKASTSRLFKRPDPPAIVGSSSKRRKISECNAAGDSGEHVTFMLGGESEDSEKSSASDTSMLSDTSPFIRGAIQLQSDSDASLMSLCDSSIVVSVVTPAGPAAVPRKITPKLGTSRSQEDARMTPVCSVGSTSKVPLQRCQSVVEESKRWFTSDSNEVRRGQLGDYSGLCALPLISGKNADLNTITHETMARVMGGEFVDTLGDYLLVDCRYPYEFDGGHIKGAENIYTKDAIYNTFLGGSKSTQTPRALIFHCEFSSERGPKMCRFLRNHDREIHRESYPKLHYPELYVLEFGYKEFFAKQKELCEPLTYVPMAHKSFSEEQKKYRSESKIWSGPGADQENSSSQEQPQSGLRRGRQSSGILQQRRRCRLF